MNTIEGLNKVDCFLGSSQSAYEGSTVTISNGNNTWSKEIVDGHAVFMIPNIPAPAKQSYTITLPNEDPEGDPVYQRTIELGFGDSVKIGLYEENEPADQGDIGAVEDLIDALASDVGDLITYGQTDLVAGTSTLKSGCIYCYY